MKHIVYRSWRQAIALALLVGLDLAVSLPIMGGTYRPFNWMNLGAAGSESVYPVIQEFSFSGDTPMLGVGGTTTGKVCVLQRSVNCADSNGWNDVMTATSAAQVVYLTDTNPVSGTVFYRVKQH